VASVLYSGAVSFANIRSFLSTASKRGHKNLAGVWKPSGFNPERKNDMGNLLPVVFPVASDGISLTRVMLAKASASLR